MDRTPAFLAALASAAVPGLDPVSVEALPGPADRSFDIAFVQDTELRRWVVRAPRTAVAGAEMDRSTPLLALLARRLPFAVPAPRGFVALAEGGRAAVYPYLPGHRLDFVALPAGPGLAGEVGRALAALHDTDPAVVEEAGLPGYDADAYRTRRLAELDRAAATGQVPAALLGRWEAALEDVALWRFAPVPTHGSLTGDRVLAVFADDTDAATGRVHAVTGWDHAQLADAADDFAALVEEAEPAAVETVLEAYAYARVERPDPHLLVRARLAAELGSVTRLLAALGRDDADAARTITARLHRLDQTVDAAGPGSAEQRRTSLTPVDVRARRTSRPPPPPADGTEDTASRRGDDAGSAPSDDTADSAPSDDTADSAPSGDTLDSAPSDGTADSRREGGTDPGVTPPGDSPTAG
ncbi:MAG: phosphotransferase [Dermatophilaceae bacterium]